MDLCAGLPFLAHRSIPLLHTTFHYFHLHSYDLVPDFLWVSCHCPAWLLASLLGSRSFLPLVACLSSVWLFVSLLSLSPLISLSSAWFPVPLFDWLHVSLPGYLSQFCLLAYLLYYQCLRSPFSPVACFHTRSVAI